MEAKECAAFLECLDKYCQPLYSSNPVSSFGYNFGLNVDENVEHESKMRCYKRMDFTYS